MIHRTSAIVLAVAALGPLSPATGAANCRIPSGHVVASDSVARLLAVPTPSGAALFACIRRDGRKIALDDSYSDARITGRWVAWERPGRPGHRRIAVHDLRTGRERLVNGRVAARSLRLSSRGSIVWAQLLDGSSATPLFANEIGRPGRLLDNGEVDATSVRLKGRRVTWFSGDVLHSATVR